ncbi:MAG: PorV/PorQ family protein [Candidatus Krumholzibacteria bacterium]|nr:PorV/PorQ family protein [Candidatus Krumholzibacteria bacterium]
MENRRQNLVLGAFIAAFLLLLLLTGGAKSDELHPQVGSSHSSLPGMDARAAGLGWAVTGLGMGASGVEFNPASLMRSESSQLFLSHSQWVLDSPLDQVFYARPFGKTGMISLGLLSMNYGSIEETFIDGSSSGRFLGASDLHGFASLSLPLHPLLRAGLTVKALQKNLGGEKVGGVMASAGVQTQEIEGIRLGLSWLDVGPPLGFRQGLAPSPWKVRFGASHRLELAPDHVLINLLDYVHPRDNFPSLGIGSEWTWRNLLSLRVGYRRSVEDDGTPEGDRFHYGFGLKHDGYCFDYAYGDHADLSPVHRVSLSWSFGKKKTWTAPVPRSIPPPRKLPRLKPLPEQAFFGEMLFGESGLMEESRKKLRHYFERLAVTPGVVGVEFRCWVVTTGDAKEDRNASLQRLQILRDTLVSWGYPHAKIGLRARGGDERDRIEAHLILD